MTLDEVEARIRSEMPTESTPYQDGVRNGLTMARQFLMDDRDFRLRDRIKDLAWRFHPANPANMPPAGVVSTRGFLFADEVHTEFVKLLGPPDTPGPLERIEKLLVPIDKMLALWNEEGIDAPEPFHSEIEAPLREARAAINQPKETR